MEEVAREIQRVLRIKRTLRWLWVMGKLSCWVIGGGVNEF